MPCVSIITSPSELGEEEEEEEEEWVGVGGESFHRPRRALDIAPTAPALPPVEVVVILVVLVEWEEEEEDVVVINGGKFSLVKW